MFVCVNVCTCVRVCLDVQVGLRNIRNWLFSPSSRLRMELSIPNIEVMGAAGNREVFDKKRLTDKQKLFKKVVSKDQPQGMAMQLSEAFEWDELYLPEENPNGIAMRIRVFEETAAGTQPTRLL